MERAQSVNEIFILSALKDGKKNGADIISWADSELKFEIPRGSIYNTLKRYEGKGLVTVDESMILSENNSKQKTYIITPLGLERLASVRSALTKLFSREDDKGSE